MIADFLEASINFKNEDVFILYAIMLVISAIICVVNFKRNK